MSSLLIIDPDKRMTSKQVVEQLYEHPLIKNGNEDLEEVRLSL